MDTKLTKRILFYGDSILLASWPPGCNKWMAWKCSRQKMGPSVHLTDINFIVTDLRDAKTSQALPMLCAVPGVSLVGLDALTETFSLLTGPSHTSHAAQAVLDLLKQQM